MPSQDDLGVAFALTAGAGMATSIGAALVFIPRFNTEIYMAVALAFAAGVMCYVSFIEIFVKSLDEFTIYFDNKNGVDPAQVTVEDYEPDENAYHAATATFFFGVIVTAALDRLIHCLHKAKEDTGEVAEVAPGMNTNGSTAEPDANQHFVDLIDRSCSYQEVLHESGEVLMANDPNQPKDQSSELGAKDDDDTPSADSAGSKSKSRRSIITNVAERKALLKMSLITGLAVALHNFPEGFATFIATVQDKNAGAAIAIAIGVHNIPEGICVAAPIYLSTGSKWKAFFWGSMSGLAEPVAGAIGWIILSDRDVDLGPLTYAIMFGSVTGMMIYISMSELIPTSLLYDPTRKYFITSFILGCAVMAASLMLFVSA